MVPAGLDLQARDRHRRDRRRQGLRDDEGRHQGLSHARRRPSSTTGTIAGSGRATSTAASAHSSDTYFFQLAGKLGIDRLAYWAEQYGFGSPTGIDLPGEVGGIVPSNEWKLDTLGAEIFPGETYQAGIGQGYDVVTPIQLINAYAALANGGTLYQPHLVKEIVGPDGEVVKTIEPTVLHKMDVKPSVLKTMRNAARSVVTLRHTYNLVDLPIKIAGKSGTAEFGTRDRQGRLPFHSWFVGFTPGNPRTGSVRQAPTRSSSSSPSPTTPEPRATWRPRS